MFSIHAVHCVVKKWLVNAPLCIENRLTKLWTTATRTYAWKQFFCGRALSIRVHARSGNQIQGAPSTALCDGKANIWAICIGFRTAKLGKITVTSPICSAISTSISQSSFFLSFLGVKYTTWSVINSRRELDQITTGSKKIAWKSRNTCRVKGGGMGAEGMM